MEILNGKLKMLHLKVNVILQIEKKNIYIII